MSTGDSLNGIPPLLRACLFIACIAPVSLTAPAADAAAVAATELRPNILVLMAEDLSARVGAFGDPIARTPNLDRLAEGGIRFPNTFTAAGVCAPSRASFITGVHQITLGAQHMRSSNAPAAAYLAVPPGEVKAFPELLRRAGYFTFTDRKLDYQFSGIRAGSGPPTIWDAEGTADHLAALPDDRPFFGLLNHFITHESAGFLPEHTTSEFGRTTAEGAVALRSRLEHRTPAERVSVPPYYPDRPQVRAHIADHYDNVQLMDIEVGRILQRLEDAGRLDRTILIWTTDHGDALPRAKRELYDSGIKVPMILHWPEHLRPATFTPGAVDERLISFVDLAPIILAMAGVPAPDYLQGRNLLAPDTPPRQYVFASRDRMDEWPDRVRAVRDARYKYLRFFRPGTPGATRLAYREQGRIMQALWAGMEAGNLTDIQRAWFEPRPEEALFDLAADPHETVNLAEDRDYGAVLTRLRSAYGAWRLRVPDTSDQAEAAMAEAFWPGGRQPVTGPPSFHRTEEGRLAISAGNHASVEYRFDNESWRLYSEPVTVPDGVAVTARAVRYGHAVSETVLAPSETP